MEMSGRRGNAAMVATDEESPDENTAQTELHELNKTLPSAVMRFTVDAQDPLSLVFAMLAEGSNIWLLLPLYRVGPLVVMGILLWWMIRLSLMPDQKEGNDVYGLYDEQPIFPNWVIVGTVYFAMLVPKVVDAHGTITEFWVLCKFSRNCLSQKPMILYSGFICLIVEFVVSPFFAAALSAYIGLMLNAKSLYIALINVLVVFFLNDMDQKFVEYLVQPFNRHRILLVRLMELKYPALTDEQWQLVDDLARKCLRERNEALKLSHTDNIFSSEMMRSYLFWKRSDRNQCDVLNSLRRNWAPTSTKERMEFWNLIVDHKRGLGISGHTGATCSVDVAFVDLTSMKEIELKGRAEDAMSLITETDWLQLSATQRENLFCNFPLQTCLFPVGRDTLDLTEQKWKSGERAKVLRTILRANPSLMLLKLNFNNLEPAAVKNIVTALQECDNVLNLAVPSEMDRIQWLSLLQIVELNRNLTIWFIEPGNTERLYSQYNPRELALDSESLSEPNRIMEMLNLPRVDSLGSSFSRFTTRFPRVLQFSTIRESGNIWLQVIATSADEPRKTRFQEGVRLMALVDSEEAKGEWKVPTNTTYRTVALTVRGHRLGGAEPITTFMKTTELEFLDVSETKMQACIEFYNIVSATHNCNVPIKLLAEGNNFGPAGARILLNLLDDRKGKVRDVSLADTNMSTESFKLIVDALKNNTWFRKLDARRNNLRGTKTMLDELKRSNKQVKILVDENMGSFTKRFRPEIVSSKTMLKNRFTSFKLDPRLLDATSQVYVLKSNEKTQIVQDSEVKRYCRLFKRSMQLEDLEQAVEETMERLNTSGFLRESYCTVEPDRKLDEVVEYRSGCFYVNCIEQNDFRVLDLAFVYFRFEITIADGIPFREERIQELGLATALNLLEKKYKWISCDDIQYLKVAQAEQRHDNAEAA